MIGAMVGKGLLTPLKVSTGRIVAAAATAALLALLAGGTATAQGAMTTTKLGPSLWETTGGGRFVDIPGFPGEKIDRRLLRDIRFLRRKYKIFITDGYSLNPVHSANGEHPIGLALDIVPNASAGGTWNDISALARWAEPTQNRARPPFRWVGYDGDAGHGRGHHLHLSYSHSTTRYNKPARTVYTLRNPKRKSATEPTDPKEPTGDSTKSGAIEANREPTSSSYNFGGVYPRYGGALLAPVAPETGGVNAP